MTTYGAILVTDEKNGAMNIQDIYAKLSGVLRVNDFVGQHWEDEHSLCVLLTGVDFDSEESRFVCSRLMHEGFAVQEVEV